MSRSYVRRRDTRTRVAHEVGHVPVPLTLRLVRLALLFPTASDLQFTSSAEQVRTQKRFVQFVRFVVKNPCPLCYLWENKNNTPSINVRHRDTRTGAAHEVGREPVPLTLRLVRFVVQKKEKSVFGRWRRAMLLTK